MAYYRICPYCGSNLDPGEACDCKTLVPKNKPARLIISSGKPVKAIKIYKHGRIYLTGTCADRR